MTDKCADNINAEVESASQINVFNTGVFLHPHFEKRHKGGEDAATVSPNLIAVADGVGGWASSGIDPAIYSKRLCTIIGEIAEKVDDHRLMNPRDIIIEASDQNKETGSSTCVIATLDRYAPFLYTANLGDSGYLLLRKNGLDLISIFRTTEQTHGFNFPFQIGTGGDDPAKADPQIHQVEHNDIIILGSDGLFDNLYDIKIIELMRPFVRDRDQILDPTLVAELIAKEAEKYSYNQAYVSPFAKSARENFYDYSGGKPDDITVIVAQITLTEEGRKVKK